MENDLDKRLFEILMDSKVDEDPKMLVDDYMLFIKQAFKEAGYILFNTDGCAHFDTTYGVCEVGHQRRVCDFCGRDFHMSKIEWDTHKLGTTLYAMPKGKDLARELSGLKQIVDDGVGVTELSPPMMTGKDWYDRFKKEWGEWPEEDCCNPGSSCEDQVRIDMRRAGLETARSAAGIEEE